jgi:RNA polymerase sigma factor (sigma-70 family)
MSVRSIEALQRYLRRLCDEAAPPEDAVLLDRFVRGNDGEAFELLIARHGPMVLGTARRLVANTHDAADVFQAVFLSLARLAKSIRQRRALPAWLHKTTCRVAAKLRANRRPLAAPPPERYEACDPAAGLVWREVCEALDEEMQRLPQRLRSPLLLCYLSGLTRDEAAKQLGWSLGTLKRRLEEGRNASSRSRWNRLPFPDDPPIPHRISASQPYLRTMSRRTRVELLVCAVQSCGSCPTAPCTPSALSFVLPGARPGRRQWLLDEILAARPLGW